VLFSVFTIEIQCANVVDSCDVKWFHRDRRTDRTVAARFNRMRTTGSERYCWALRVVATLKSQGRWTSRRLGLPPGSRVVGARIWNTRESLQLDTPGAGYYAVILICPEQPQYTPSPDTIADRPRFCLQAEGCGLQIFSPPQPPRPDSLTRRHQPLRLS